MKNILCYGDSNTYGVNPVTGERLDASIRWTKQLQKQLGDHYNVIEEGLCGRTTVFDNPLLPGRRGSDYLIPCLQTHLPLDLVIFMLGTNDLKEGLSLNASLVALGMEQLLKLALNPFVYGNYSVPDFLLISPIHISNRIKNSPFGGDFAIESVDISKQLAPLYQQLAKQYGCHFLDAARYAEPSKVDAIHLDEENHQKMANAISQKVEEILNNNSYL